MTSFFSIVFFFFPKITVMIRFEKCKKGRFTKIFYIKIPKLDHSQKKVFHFFYSSQEKVFFGGVKKVNNYLLQIAQF